MPTSKLQRYTGSQLRHRFVKYGIVENTRPDWLVSTKGERLELDFYLERLGIAVEVQGGQHFKFTPIFHATKWDFQEQLRRDREKLEICQRAGIDLLYVCKRSDVEIVLTACYDVLKPKNTTDITWNSKQRNPLQFETVYYPRAIRKAFRKMQRAIDKLQNGSPKTNKFKRYMLEALRSIEQHENDCGKVEFANDDERRLKLVAEFINR